MKRAFVISLATLILLSFLVSAAPSDIIEEKLGVNPADIPQTTEQIKEDYLKQNWQEIITNNAVLGRINTFFTKISSIFQILFGQPYSLSPQLFFVILLWIYIITKIDSALNSFGMFNRAAQIVISIGSGIVLAQLNVFALIIAALAKIVFAPEAWWVRIIAILISIVVLLFMHFIINKGIYAIKQTKAGKEAQKNKYVLGQVKEFIKGIKAGQKLED